MTVRKDQMTSNERMQAYELLGLDRLSIEYGPTRIGEKKNL